MARAASADRPIAVNTCEGSVPEAVQAAPAEAQMPARSSLSRIGSASIVQGRLVVFATVQRRHH